MNIVQREEKKFLINALQVSSLAARFNATLTPDVHNSSTGYIIRSLYFDTLDDQDYVNKVDGVELRRKIRLRIYRTDADFAMLEMKQKEGPYQVKRSLRITRPHVLQLIQADYSPLLTYEDPFAAECFYLMHQQQYRPKTIVEYHRRAYVGQENHIRITLDTNIIATESSFDFYNPQLAMNPVMNPFQAILKVKFNGFLLSYFKDLLQVTNRSEISVSKYTLARSFSYGYQL